MEEKWIPFPTLRLDPLPQDIDCAVSLLGWPTENPLPTQPTEKEGRAALTRILYSQAQATYLGKDDVPGALLTLYLLAIMFGTKDPRRHVVFKNRNKRSRRSWDIATAMHALYKKGGKGGYEKAAEKTAEQLSLSDRHVKRAYAKHKNNLK